MKMDMANFTLQQIRPYIQKQSVEYEANKFKQFLQSQDENGIDGLQFTKAWLERAFLKYNSDAVLSSSFQAASSAPPATPAAILNCAYMELLEWHENQVFPESLLMDEGRFTDLRNKSRWLSLVSAILLVTYNTVGEAITGISGFKESLKEQISIILPTTSDSDIDEKAVNVAEQINKEVLECLRKHDFPAMDEAKQGLLKGQIQSVASSDHSVHKLMKSRLMAFIHSLISQPQSRDVQLPPGFSAVSEELSHICGQFLRLVSHNRAVFGSYYTDIISRLLSDAGSAAK
ncbi:T-complex protein 11-like protein 1 [Lamellibrachia satsuma]|nr:T-complex protein 11-like protein 1 [Lamellibrachia satsuma]